MDVSLIVLLEVLLIFGGVLTFALWEIRSVRRSRRSGRLEPIRSANQQRG